MGEIFHKHPVFTTYVSDKTCGILNGHDASCSKYGLTNANEVECVVDSIDATKCKCTHRVPDDMIAEPPRGEFTIISERTVRKTRRGKVSKKVRGKKKTAARKKPKRKTRKK